MVLPAPGTSIAVSQIQTEFAPITNPVPMDAKLRFPSTTYTPTTPTIPVTPSTILKMSDYNGKSLASVTPFITPFTAPGTWTSPFTGNIKVLCVGGGGGGCASPPLYQAGGGGGGGVTYNVVFPVTAGVIYTVTIGAGGTGPASSNRGGNTTFTGTSGTVTAGGGGGGGSSFVFPG